MKDKIAGRRERGEGGGEKDEYEVRSTIFLLTPVS